MTNSSRENSTSANRLSRLRTELDEARLDAIVLTSRPNSFYFTQFECTNSTLVVSVSGESYFLTDFRYVEAAERTLPPEWKLVRTASPQAEEELAEILKRLNVRRLGFEGTASWRFWEKLRTCAPADCELCEAEQLITSLRSVKDPEEVAAIRRAQQLAERVLARALDQLPSPEGAELRERDLLRWIRTAMLEHDTEESFPTIVAFGPNSSLPHAVPGLARVADGDVVLIDMGVRVDHYCSDMTRVFAWGHPLSGRLAEIYEVVREAQTAALEAIRPGVAAAEIDRVARDHIARAGYAECFGHGLGHGVGLEIHEPPTLNPRSRDILREGMVITIEPGIYIPGVGGIRIEDLIVVTADGHDNLTHFPKNLRSLSFTPDYTQNRPR